MYCTYTKLQTLVFVDRHESKAIIYFVDAVTTFAEQDNSPSSGVERNMSYGTLWNLLLVIQLQFNAFDPC